MGNGFKSLFQIVDAVNIVLATVAEIQLYKYWGVVKKTGYFMVRLIVRVDPLPLHVRLFVNSF